MLGAQEIVLEIVSLHEEYGGISQKDLISKCVKMGIDKKTAKAVVQQFIDDGVITGHKLTYV